MTNPLDLSQAEIDQLPPDGGPGYNRLIFESSPYLLQHAANPVDWHPWGPAAFDLARQQDKPVFLSIGYATCHWCHVMEHESFEDAETARMMNETFICIKVDREERPDIDSVYMTVTQALTGQGGWPMTVLLTPDKLPFFAGTYFPRESRFGRPGMRDLVPQIDQIWKEDRQRILESADSISTQLSRINAGEPGDALTADHLNKAFEELRDRFDPFRGGFSDRPKFPVPHNLSYLLRHHHRTGNTEALNMVEKTLVHMRHGGIFDHVGFGFHRYSTDEMWLLPHFEKMLYDQALIVRAAVEAWLVTGKDEFRRTAEET
ncbi:MAG: thioredoxin domain-containing protein, partial [Candidatus Sumerlaeia bacterium]|nr:thioredoxin domain-containing protein [Candidatus Sumerlaeia bacterium]